MFRSVNYIGNLFNFGILLSREDVKGMNTQLGSLIVEIRTKVITKRKVGSLTMQPAKHDITGMPLYQIYQYTIRSITLLLAIHTLVLLVNTYNIENYFGKFEKILLSMEKYYQKFWKIIWKYLKEKSENFENHCGEFRGIFP